MFIPDGCQSSSSGTQRPRPRWAFSLQPQTDNIYSRLSHSAVPFSKFSTSRCFGRSSSCTSSPSSASLWRDRSRYLIVRVVRVNLFDYKSKHQLIWAYPRFIVESISCSHGPSKCNLDPTVNIFHNFTYQVSQCAVESLTDSVTPRGFCSRSM